MMIESLFESLESRQMLAVTAIYRNDGVLVVTGTRRADHIEVGLEHDLGIGSTRVFVKGKGYILFDEGNAIGIILIGGGGADHLFISQSMGSGSPVTVRGGDGDDVIHLGGYGGFDSLVFAGRGDDRIDIADEYGSGNEIIHGGPGDDLIQRASRPSNWGDEIYHPFPAIIHGDAGNDRLISGDGNDKIFGGNGNDTLRGGFGNDLLVGGAGKDRLVGGAGENKLTQD